MAKTHFHDIGGGVCIHLQMCVKGKGLDFHHISLEREWWQHSVVRRQAAKWISPSCRWCLPVSLPVSSLQMHHSDSVQCNYLIPPCLPHCLQLPACRWCLPSSLSPVCKCITVQINVTMCKAITLSLNRELCSKCIFQVVHRCHRRGNVLHNRYCLPPTVHARIPFVANAVNTLIARAGCLSN